MCGTVGMFVGCAALSYCPRTLLTRDETNPAENDGTDGTDGSNRTDRTDGKATPEATAEEETAYRSPFQTWYERASVRTAPRRMVQEQDTRLHFFAPDLVPVAKHPLVKELPEEVFGELLIQHLYRYLHFTAKLEFLVVNRTVLGLAEGSVGLHLPDEMRFDAWKMYCDEAYHTLFSVDLRRQVAQRTGVVPMLPEEPFFLRRLRQILDELAPAERPLAELLFVIVSETLISASLAELPDSDGIVPAVRETIRDHASDEGRHHAYFAMLLRRLWAQLEGTERRLVGVLVPRLMDAFLRPDLVAMGAELASYGMDSDAVEQTLAEVYSPEILNAHARATSRMTRRYFEAVGAFADPKAKDELHSYGYLG
ncbi:diiron oxygenase [Streptomyces sp. NPDC002276]